MDNVFTTLRLFEGSFFFAVGGEINNVLHPDCARNYSWHSWDILFAVISVCVLLYFVYFLSQHGILAHFMQSFAVPRLSTISWTRVPSGSLMSTNKVDSAVHFSFVKRKRHPFCTTPKKGAKYSQPWKGESLPREIYPVATTANSTFFVDRRGCGPRWDLIICADKLRVAWAVWFTVEIYWIFFLFLLIFRYFDK